MTLHADALATLGAFDPALDDASQWSLRERYLHVLSAHDDACHRTCLPEHLTASALVLHEDRVLLTLHAKAGRWFQFGGHCEPTDTTLAGAALREAREESGVHDLAIDPTPIHLSAHEVPFCGPPDQPTPTVHLDVRFLVTLTTTDPRIEVSDESTDVAWWPVDALPDPDDADLADLVSSARQRVEASTHP